MEKNKVLESYKKNFKSPLGAYVYMMLNQNTPEFFKLSSNVENSLSDQLESVLLKTENLDNLIKDLNQIPSECFDFLVKEVSENDVSKDRMLKLVSNLKYLNINFASNDSWDELYGFIEYNSYSEFILDKKDLKEKLKEYANKFSLASLSLNPNFEPMQFLENFQNGVQVMCSVLGFDAKQIGLNVLNLNYKTENGDFTGYVNYSSDESHGVLNKMVINKSEVFAHEWMHFLESSLGIRNHSLTGLMDHNDSLIKTIISVFPEYEKILSFKKVVNTNDDSYSEKSLSEALISSASFLERYALNKKDFYNNIELLSLEFEKNYSLGKSKKECLDLFESSIKELLETPHPTRYFSFLKAQCEIYIDKINDKKIEKNQFLDFAKKSDEHLKLDNYTQSTIEIFARTFESFLFDKIKKASQQSCVVHNSYDNDFYPQSTMREKTNILWEEMWEDMKKRINKCMDLKENEIEKYMTLTNIESLRVKFFSDKKIQESPKYNSR